MGLESGDVQKGFALKFWRALKKSDINLAMREMQAYLASIPYVEGFKKKLESVATAEGFYEYTFYLVFSMLNVYVRTQVKCSQGRVDMVVWMPDTIYVKELKVNGPADAALKQINDRGYALQISVGSGRCHHCSRPLPSLAAAAANHVPARCQPEKHAPFPSAVPPAPCLSCVASPESTLFRLSSAMLTCMSSLF